MSYFHNFKSNEFSFFEGKGKDVFGREAVQSDYQKLFIHCNVYFCNRLLLFFKAVAKAFLLFAKH